jgi:PPOX class probable F420-dependent enzyme
MPRPQMTDDERDAFLAEPHVAVLSVTNDDGRPPHAVPVWYAYEPSGNLTFYTQTQGRIARKTRLIQAAGAVTLCVQREEFPYRYVTVEGTVVAADQPPTQDQMLAITSRYLPPEQASGMVDHELANPNSELILFTVRPDRWLTFDLSNPD